MFRIGHGYDAHRLVEGRKLILGGVDIPHTLGLLGHSDADVLTHAVCDALLGAAGLGDIGNLFPDNDMTYKNIYSMLLLEKVCEKLSQNGFEIEYIDSTIVAQQPKMAPYIQKMRETVARYAGIEVSRFNVKATTEEKMGFTGNLEGIAAHAV